MLSHSSPPIAGPVPGRRWADSKGLPVQVPDTNPSPPVWPQPPGPPLSTSPCPRCPSSSLRPTGALGTLFLVTPYPTHSSLTWSPPASYQTDSCLPPRPLVSPPHSRQAASLSDQWLSPGQLIRITQGASKSPSPASQTNYSNVARSGQAAACVKLRKWAVGPAQRLRPQAQPWVRLQMGPSHFLLGAVTMQPFP